MAIGAGIVWLAVVALGVFAIRAGTRPAANGRRDALLIIGGGAVVPSVLLAVLLVRGLALLPELLARAPQGSLQVSVSGEQWWWRVRYHSTGGEMIDLANEIRLPVDAPVEFHLESPDVIHSFWIPSLGGKVDMIPGRRTRLTLQPLKTGVYRGVCAEYCGTGHALMAFPVVVLEQQEFQGWLAHQARPAQLPVEPLAIRGQELFLANGCSACHAIRGTPADGMVGPDLTHVGSRLSLGSGTLPSARGDFVRWIAQTRTVKPGVHMPAFGMLPPADLEALGAYLKGLE
jgi:cytochrome c oxidase subunit 2